MHNPVGFPPAVVGKQMAPRLESLSGKRIMVIDPRFDDGTGLLMRVMDRLAARIPEIQLEYVTLPGHYGHDFTQLWDELAQRGDGAIIGVGHCSTCAPAVSNIAIRLESDFGLPTVAIHTHVFARVVRSVCAVSGMPALRQVFVPHPVIGKSDDELDAYVLGNDPLTGVSIVDELVAGLTLPLDVGEHHAASFERSTPRFVDADCEEGLQAQFRENGWTDQLPIILPTAERVEAMLEGTSRNPDEVVGALRPTSEREAWSFTVEKVAVNAVMAGALPHYLPVILALASSGITARPSSTASMSAMAVINGPIRDEIGMNYGLGAMGPYNHVNATIGRAYGLLSQNLQGGSVPGLSYMGSQGNPMTYSNLCFAENETASPWSAFHVDHGFSASQSAVSVFMGSAYISSTLAFRQDSWREQLRTMLVGMDPTPCAPTLLLDPLAAEQFVRVGGFAEKAALIEWIRKHALQRGSIYWDLQMVRNYVLPEATAGKEPMAAKLAAGPDAMIELFDPAQISVVVVGGATKPYWSVAGPRYMRTVGIDEWR